MYTILNYALPVGLGAETIDLQALQTYSHTKCASNLKAPTPRTFLKMRFTRPTMVRWRPLGVYFFGKYSAVTSNVF